MGALYHTGPTLYISCTVYTRLVKLGSHIHLQAYAILFALALTLIYELMERRLEGEGEGGRASEREGAREEGWAEERESRRGRARVIQ